VGHRGVVQINKVKGEYSITRFFKRKMVKDSEGNKEAEKMRTDL